MACASCEPCAVCCIVCPPPIPSPTVPQPVKPLSLPCPYNNNNNGPQISPEDAERFRYDNFYNNYNMDWRDQPYSDCPDDPRARERKCGVTYDGQKCGENAICSGMKKNKKLTIEERSCPTGFKICSMKLTPPAGCHPCGVWCAQIQPCPPKSKKSNKYKSPDPCTRPCCKHYKPKDDDCKYDKPCKAHCYDAEPGRRASLQNRGGGNACC